MLGYGGDALTSHGGPFSWRWSATITDVFVTYRGKAGRRADRHHQRPPRASHWRPTGDTTDTTDTADTADTADRLAARLAAVPVTSGKDGHRPRASGKAHGGKAHGQRQGRPERE